MDLRQLRYFLAVAEELHFGKAAEREHIAEQPLGYQVRKLEEELGFRLLDRTTRSVSLTPAGELFRTEAQAILEHADRATDAARRVSTGEAGVVRLGYEAGCIPHVFPEFVKAFRRAYGDIDLLLTESNYGSIDDLRAERVDAAMVSRYTKLPSWVDYLPIRRFEAVVALPAGHPLTKKESVRLRDLKDESFIGYDYQKGGNAQTFILGLSNTVGADIEVAQVAQTYLSLLGMVAAGMGVGIVNSNLTDLFANQIEYRTLEEPHVPTDIGIAWRRGDVTPAAGKLLEVARHMAREYSQVAK